MSALNGLSDRHTTLSPIIWLTENPVSTCRAIMCVVLLFISVRALGQDRGDELEASILVVDPGAEIYSSCGHAAIRMQSPAHGLDICFSYLVDECDHPVLSALYEPNKQGLVAIPMDEYTADLEAERRGYDEYTLNLTYQEKQRLWRLLDEEWGKGMYIDYDFIRGGCAIQLHDIVVDACRPSTIELYPNAETPSIKALISPHLYGRLDVAYLMSFVIDEEANDSQIPNKALVIPHDLAETYRRSHIKDADNHIRPLISKTSRWEPLTPAASPTSCWCPLWYTGLIAAILALTISSAGIQLWSNSKVLVRGALLWDIAVVGLSGLLALFLLSVEIFSPLYGTKYNILLLVYNLLPAAAVLLQAIRRRGWAKAALIAYSVTLTAYIVVTLAKVGTETWFILPHYILGAAIWLCTFEIYIRHKPIRTKKI